MGSPTVGRMGLLPWVEKKDRKTRTVDRSSLFTVGNNDCDVIENNVATGELLFCATEKMNKNQVAKKLAEMKYGKSDSDRLARQPLLNVSVVGRVVPYLNQFSSKDPTLNELVHKMQAALQTVLLH